jgi:hypothetical protein
LYQLNFADGPLAESAEMGLFDRVSNLPRRTRPGLDPSDGQVRLKVAVFGVVAEVACLRLYPLLEFLQLFQVASHSDPNHARASEIWKAADIFQGELKLRLTFARVTQRDFQAGLLIRRHVAQELECQMELFRSAPTDEFAMHPGLELSLDLLQSFDQRRRDGDGDESADSFQFAGQVHTGMPHSA